MYDPLCCEKEDPQKVEAKVDFNHARYQQHNP